MTYRYRYVDFALSLPEPDTVSVEGLFRLHYGRITRMLARLTGDRGQAEEIAADVFHKLSRRPDLIQDRADVTPWLYRVATNAGLDALRTNARRRKREELSEVHAVGGSAPDSMLRQER